MSHVRATKGPDRTHKVTVMLSDEEHTKFKALMRSLQSESVAEGVRKAIEVAYDIKVLR